MPSKEQHMKTAEIAKIVGKVWNDCEMSSKMSWGSKRICVQDFEVLWCWKKFLGAQVILVSEKGLSSGGGRMGAWNFGIEGVRQQWGP